MTATASIYHDLSGLQTLRREARAQSADGVDKVARQFESLFIQMMLKSMRDATPKSELFASDQMDMYQSMFDQQISLDLAREGGIGLGDTLREQLGGARASSPEESAAAAPTGEQREVRQLLDELTRYRLQALPSAQPQVDSAAAGAAGNPVAASWRPQSPAEYVRDVWHHARSSAQDLGVDPRVLVAQSALETGWGRKVISDPQGRSSHNLFGIKADAGWQGRAVSVNTLEYRADTPRTEVAQFRAYDSIADSFRDYVDFLQQNPRYRDALASAADSRQFVTELQRAGYATDPAYAEKVLAVLDGLDP